MATVVRGGTLHHFLWNRTNWDLPRVGQDWATNTFTFTFTSQRVICSPAPCTIAGTPYFITLCFADTARFTSWFSMAILLQQSLLAPFFQHFLTLCLCVTVWFCCCYSAAKSCPILGDHTDCSLPGSSVHRILQARILEWVVMPSSRESSQPRDCTHVSGSSALAGGFFTSWAFGEADCLQFFKPSTSKKITIHQRLRW